MIFADLDLARRLERAEGAAGASFVESRGLLMPELRAEWKDFDGTYAMFDDPDSGVTQTFGLGMFGDVSADWLDRVEAFFRERGAPTTHEVCPLAGVPLAALLCQRGYRPVEFTSVLYRPLDGAGSGVVNARARARLMRDDERELCSDLFARGWGDSAEAVGVMLDLGRIIAASPGSIAFCAEIDGVAVATGVLRMDGGVALLAGACTVPEARKNGAQRALLDARLSYAKAHACDLAMMCTAPGGESQRNAEREGFRIAYTRTKWQLAK